MSQNSALETQVFSSAAVAEEARRLAERLKAAEDRDLGFGAEVSRRTRRRLLNRDGSFNVRRVGYSLFGSRSLYHTLLGLSWPKFMLFVLGAFLLNNFVFGVVYFALGAGAIGGMDAASESARFIESFFFSVQTFGTIGYGKMYPQGVAANLVVTIEALAGLLAYALATGLVFARFSRPTARIRFSRFALISPFQGKTSFQFRIVNERQNQILDLCARVVMSRLESDGGVTRRKFYDLPLERKQVMFFPLNWTIVHPIDEASPLYGIGPEEYLRADVEFLVLLNGIDDSFNQEVHSRSSYKHDEIVWGAKFAHILEELENGYVQVDLNRVSDFDSVKLESPSK